MSSKLGNEKKNLYTNMEVRKTNDQLQKQCRWKIPVMCHKEQVENGADGADRIISGRKQGMRRQERQTGEWTLTGCCDRKQQSRLP